MADLRVMGHSLRAIRVLLFLVVVSASGVAISEASAQEEVPLGSALRKELFELARPKIEQTAKQSVRFQGSMKQLNGWAFFTGTLVDAAGAVIPVGPAESGDTAILWTQRNGKWSVVEAATGFTDVIYLDWSEKHKAPAALLGN